MNDFDPSLLESSLSSCRERIGSLKYSIAKTSGLFPMELDNLERLTEEQKESIDAMILRYSQCVSMIQDQLFRGVLLAEQEELEGRSNRDKSLLMEKLGAIKSANDFGAAAVLRNKFAHHYPKESGEQLEKLNTLPDESEFVVEVFESISSYVNSKNLLENKSSKEWKLK